MNRRRIRVVAGVVAQTLLAATFAAALESAPTGEDHQGTTRLAVTTTPESVITVPSVRSIPFFLTLSSDGRFLAGKQFIDKATYAAVWNAKTQEQIGLIRREWVESRRGFSRGDKLFFEYEREGGICTVTLSPTGHKLALSYWSQSGLGGEIEVFALPEMTLQATMRYASSRLLQEMGTRGFPSVTFSPDERLLLNHRKSRLVVWNLEGGYLAKDLDVDSHYGSAMAFSADGGTLATSSSRDKVTLWDTETWLPGVRLNAVAPVTRIAFSPDGTLIATLSFRAPWARRYEETMSPDEADPNSGGEALPKKGASTGEKAHMEPVGVCMYMQLWEAKTGKMILQSGRRVDSESWKDRVRPHIGRLRGTVFSYSPKGDLLATTDGRVLTLRDIPLRQPRIEIGPFPEGSEIVALSEDWSTLAVTTEKSIQLWGLNKLRGQAVK